MINKKHLKQPKGFTLVETLIAVIVLMYAIVGPLTIAARGLQATVVAKDEETAFYLAQDAVEYVRWVRDTNKLRSQSWLAGLDGNTNNHTTNNSLGTPGVCTSAYGSQSCMIDSRLDYVTSCSASSCSTPLYYDSTANFFITTATNGVDTVVPTIFVRTVRMITPVGTNDCTAGKGCEVSVIVNVSWKDQGTLQRMITVTENLHDWQS